MKNFNLKIRRAVNPYILIVVFYIIFSWFIYKEYPDFAKSNFFFASITFITGGLAFYIYTQQRFDNKRDAARLILQEIRRAESIIRIYKEQGAYQFAKKIIATNSWNKNIHYFVGDLDNDELDKISDLYSTGEYLDGLIKDISNLTFQGEISSSIQKNIIQESGVTITGQNPTNKVMQFIMPAPWKGRLDLISQRVETIYHSTILSELKKIAQL